MGPSRTIVFVAALVGAVSASTAAWASACIESKNAGGPVAYTSPAQNTQFIFKITYNPDSRRPDVAHQRYRVKSVNGDQVRWFREPIQGKGPIEDLTLYRAFARVATTGGWTFKFDTEAYNGLWPLQQGNSVNYEVSAVKGGDVKYKLKVTMCVRGSKTLKLQVGEYPGHLVDITLKAVGEVKDLPWDHIETNAWYVPEFGTALLMDDRVWKKGNLILIRRREAVELQEIAPKPAQTAKEPASEPPPPNFQFPGLNMSK
jgi:hypothetical protein